MIGVNRRRMMGGHDDGNIVIVEGGLRNVGGILNTGVMQATNLEVILDGKINIFPERSDIFLITQNNNYVGQGALYIGASYASIYFFVKQASDYHYTSLPKDTSRHMFHVHDGIIEIDGQSVGTCDTISFNNTFARAVKLMSSTDRSASSAYDCTIYSCKLKDGGVLVRDYYPAFSRRDNAYCFYDMVNKTILLPDGGTLELDT